MNKIFWHEGLFLQPHHFEILEKNLEEKCKEEKIFYWGVRSFELNEEALKNNEIDITEMKIILKDGSFISLDNSVIFNKFLNNQNGIQTLFIGVKKLKDSENVEISEDSDLKGDKRFICDMSGKEVKDLYAQEIANIKFLYYSVKLFLENEIESVVDYELIPVAKINLDEKKLEEYIPPLVNISDNYLMQKKVEAIYNILIEKITKLEEYKLPFSTDYSSSKYLKFLNILQILNKVAIKFYVLNEYNKIHPFELYIILRELIAQLSTFSDRINFYGRAKNGNNLLKNYNHIKLLDVMNDFEILIKEMLDEVVMGPEYTIPLDKEDSIFSAILDNRIFEKNYSYYLVVKPQNNKDFVEKFTKLVKISSKEKIPLLIQRALPGLKLENIKALEGMPITEGVFYFKLDIFDKEWQEIVKTKTIGVFYKELEFVELIVMKE